MRTPTLREVWEMRVTARLETLGDDDMARRDVAQQLLPRIRFKRMRARTHEARMLLESLYSLINRYVGWGVSR